MFAEDFADLSRRFIACFHGGDAVAAAAFYAPEGELHLSASRVLRGRAEIASHFAADIAGLAAAGQRMPELQTLWQMEQDDMACAMQRFAGDTTTVMLCLRRDPVQGWLVVREAVLRT